MLSWKHKPRGKVIMQAKASKDENSYNNDCVMLFRILLLLSTRIIRESTQIGVGFFVYLFVGPNYP